VNVLALCLALLMSLPVLSKKESKHIRWATPQQPLAFNYGPYPMLMSGGWGAGKTWLGCMKGLALSEEYPHNRGLVMRHIGRDLRDTTMTTWYKVCPGDLYNQRKGGRRNDQNGYLRLWKSGSEVIFRHLDDPETATFIKGFEGNWFLWDQAEENPEKGEELFDMLCARMGRWDQAEVPPRVLEWWRKKTNGEEWPYLHPESGRPVPPPFQILTCNPDVETHWLYRRFHPESEDHEAYRLQGYRMFDMPSFDNQFLPEANKRFLVAQDEAFKRRNVYGLWGQPEGAIHVVHPSSVLEGTPRLIEWLRRNCTLFRTLDHGESAPTCCVWWAVDRNGNVFAWMEYYMPNKTIVTHRKNIAGLSFGDSYDANYADPSIFDMMPVKQGGRFNVASEYSDASGVYQGVMPIHWIAADNNELGTRNRINEYLRYDEDRIHPISGQPGSARLFFVKSSDAWPQGIRHALKQTRNQRRLKIGTELGHPIFSDERDAEITDHAYDPVRYMIASRPPAPAAYDPAIIGTFSGARKILGKLARISRIR
jgi:hypothetical protein